MNLDTLKNEIEQHLKNSGFAIFHGCSRGDDKAPAVYWDCERYPDYHAFLDAAQAAGVKIIVLHHRELTRDELDEAIQRLGTCDLPREENRSVERRLAELRVYEGFTCVLELSFDHQGSTFLYDLRTDWYDELTDIASDLQLMSSGQDDDAAPMGGYFSKN
jgi:hypothetical protein